MRKTPLKSARRRASWTAWTSLRLAHPAHEAEQNQKKRTYDVLPKPDNLIRYRQPDNLVSYRHSWGQRKAQVTAPLYPARGRPCLDFIRKDGRSVAALDRTSIDGASMSIGR